MEGNEQNLAAVILAGGAGHRLWPLGTEREPKQFIKLLGDKSLLEISLERALALVPAERVLVLTSSGLADRVREQLPQVPADNVIGEPLRKDTAAAVALAAVLAQNRFGDPVMAVLTADHLIEPLESFTAAVMSAARAAAASGALYTFGVKPTAPATGYGYLERGEKIEPPPGPPSAGFHLHHRVRNFKEKPDPATAEVWLGSGRHFWNSGMFVFRASAILAEFERHLPDHFRALGPLGRLEGTPAFSPALREAFEKLSPISIDHGVMEKAQDVRMVETDFTWSDVGGWEAIWELMEKDGDENATRGRVLLHEARRNLVFCGESEEAVVLIGVDDLVVVRAGARTLVAPRSCASELKRLMDKIKALEPSKPGSPPATG